MLPLAQLSADMAGPVVAWILGASGVLWFTNQAFDFYKAHIREQPTPSDTYATKAELREVHGRIKRERDEVNARIAGMDGRIDGVSSEVRSGFKDLDKKRSDSIAGLHKAIDTVEDQMGGHWREEVKGIRQILSDMLTAIGRLQGRNEK